jgi:hypothetical protein
LLQVPLHFPCFPLLPPILSFLIHVPIRCGRVSQYLRPLAPGGRVRRWLVLTSARVTAARPLFLHLICLLISREVASCYP